MSFDFKMSQLGSIQAEADAAKAAFATSNWLGVKAAGAALQKGLRDDVLRSGIRRATVIAKTWRFVMRPVKSDGKFLDAAIVFNRSAIFGRILAQDRVSRSKSGKYLPIPIGRAARLKLPIGRPRRQLLAFAEQTFGELTLGKLKSGKLALGIVTRTPKGKDKFEPLFVLEAVTYGKKKVDPTGVERRMAAELQQIWLTTLGSTFAVSAENNVPRRDVRQGAKLPGFTFSGGGQ